MVGQSWFAERGSYFLENFWTLTLQGLVVGAIRKKSENVDAIAFYERAGWVVTERLIHTVEHGISYDERVLMKRSLPCAPSA